jgi:acyl dehydratase
MTRSTSRIIPTLETARAYAEASGDRNPIHTDPDAAVAAGLPGSIMHGLWTMAKLAQTIGNPLTELRVEFVDYVVPDVDVIVQLDLDDERGECTLTAAQNNRTVARGSARMQAP